jgi:hypothetical protein
MTRECPVAGRRARNLRRVGSGRVGRSSATQKVVRRRQLTGRTRSPHREVFGSLDGGWARSPGDSSRDDACGTRAAEDRAGSVAEAPLKRWCGGGIPSAGLACRRVVFGSLAGGWERSPGDSKRDEVAHPALSKIGPGRSPSALLKRRCRGGIPLAGLARRREVFGSLDGGWRRSPGDSTRDETAHPPRAEDRAELVARVPPKRRCEGDTHWLDSSVRERSSDRSTVDGEGHRVTRNETTYRTPRS